METKNAENTIPPVYILTHGRPSFCEKNTISALRRQKFSGNIVLIVDDEDEEIEGYKNLGYDVEVFSKKDTVCDTHLPHTGKIYTSILYARQAAFDVAKRRGDRYFCTMDDDYQYFEIKCRMKDKMLNLYQPSDINGVMKLTYDILKTTNASCVAWAQTGDLVANRLTVGSVRKAMNTLFFDTNRKYEFYGLFDQDTTAYSHLGICGGLVLTIPFIVTKQHLTQKESGGLTESYKKFGTYVKALFPVMKTPSAIKVSKLGVKNFRIHHRIMWENCAPRILSPDWQQRMKEKGYTGTRAKLNRKHVQTKVNKFIS